MCRYSPYQTYLTRNSNFRAGSGNVVVGGPSSVGTNGTGGSTSSVNGGIANKGPDEEKIKEILERTGYTLDVTTGQRKFGGPPPGWEGDTPSKGCEVSIDGLNGDILTGFDVV